METVGLIAAMPQESQALLHCIKGWEGTTPGSMRGFRLKMMERECLLITSGMGFKRASAAARILVETTHPQFLICFGIAGAVKEDLNIGDVVISANSCQLDEGLPSHFQPLAALSEAAWDGAVQALELVGSRLVHGTAITTGGSQLVMQPDDLDNPVLEMETAGIAQVAAKMGIPLLSIRSISDGPNAPIPLDLGEVMDENANLRIGRMLMMVLRRPQIILQSQKMMKNTRIACDHAAKVVAAVLNQPTKITT
jgi:adenosylhomocysteine nucleosidase